MRATGVVRARLLAAGCSVVLALGAVAARAAGEWIESGDPQLRTDLLLLNDAGVIRFPASQWPLPRATLDYLIDSARDYAATNAAVAQALARLRGRVAASRGAGLHLDARVSAGQSARLRDFNALAREDVEVGGRAEYSGSRFSAALNVTGTNADQDSQSVRLDGSHATLQLGNWLVSANTLDRFWGPGHESSLILSNNARPMPTLLVERAVPRPFEWPILRLLGPWRFSFGVSRMESERLDIDSPLFMAWRVSIMPSQKLELGFSRTAQFCGEQLQCNFKVFGNLLIGNDNVGIDATPENEPGNQMAGFDARWSSPIGNLPYAVYAQMIGEDESSYLPVKYLEQFGLETWKPLSNGGVLLAFAEYSDTTCSASRSNPRFNCAYNQGRFEWEGYRYRGRVIGHTSDRDAENYAVGVSFTEPAGNFWSLTVRKSHLNRDPQFDPNNTVSAGPAEYQAVEAGWRAPFHGFDVQVQLGAESFEPLGASRDVEPFGFVSIRRAFGR